MERPVYRAGRVCGVGLLDVPTGGRVLDIGCGTGLNFPLLRAAVGVDGLVVGVDNSRSMLAEAAQRIARGSWSNVHLVSADAGALSHLMDDQLFDAAVFTYSLSVISEWEAAWDAVVKLLRPGARIVVVDLALPSGWGRVLSPLARFACFLGGSDPHRHPWIRVIAQSTHVSEAALRGGHIQIAAGTVGQDRSGNW